MNDMDMPMPEVPEVPEIPEIEPDIPEIPEVSESSEKASDSQSDTGLNTGATTSADLIKDELVHNSAQNPQELPPQIPGMLITQDTDGVNVLHLPDKSSKLSQRLEQRMENGVVDLSTPTEWGKYAHGAYEESLETVDPSAKSEVPVTWTDESGIVHTGRIDSLTDTAIWDFKTGDLSSKTDSQLMSELGKFAEQLENYANSDQVPQGLEKVVFFEKPPQDSSRVQTIESFFKGKGITVKWGDL